ncbi:MAG: helix-turn-helix transcriptional regulator [Actinomycetota bacterium]
MSVSEAATTFGQRLRAARLERGLSQEKLARELDVSTGSVRAWEKGQWGPGWDQFERVCKLFGWRLPFLEGPPNPTSSDRDTARELSRQTRIPRSEPPQAA